MTLRSTTCGDHSGKKEADWDAAVVHMVHKSLGPVGMILYQSANMYVVHVNTAAYESTSSKQSRFPSTICCSRCYTQLCLSSIAVENDQA